MKKSKLSLAQKLLITVLIADLYYRVQAKYLGHRFQGPPKYKMQGFTADRKFTLDGIYLFTLAALYGINLQPDEKELEGLATVTQNYFEIQRLKTTNKLITELSSVKNKKEANKILKESLESASSSIEKILNTEIKTVQSFAERYGVSKLAAKDGIEDPVIVKFGIVDDKICEACKKLWHTKGNLFMPRPWKLSELNMGYSSHKNIKATISPTHPRCRHTISYVPPGYGFTDSGKMEFKKEGYDYYKEYYKINKKEELEENLFKSCTCDDHLHLTENLIF
jgi:hypothetical protein